MKYVSFPHRIYMIGFGSIGEGVLPLILRHIDVKPEQITIITADDRGHNEASDYKIDFVKQPLTKDNYREVLGARLNKGDFIVNVSVDVSCVALMELAQEKGALYIDTVVEPWAGYYTDAKLSATQRSNYGLRETMLALQPKYLNGPTAVSCHGANPGLVNHFVKQALLDIARDTGMAIEKPTSREAWGNWPKNWASRSFISPSAIRKSPISPRKSANSSTRGRSTVSIAKAASLPNWAGARMKRLCLPTG